MTIGQTEAEFEAIISDINNAKSNGLSEIRRDTIHWENAMKLTNLGYKFGAVRSSVRTGVRGIIYHNTMVAW